jgi:hypothetical protein
MQFRTMILMLALAVASMLPEVLAHAVGAATR